MKSKLWAVIAFLITLAVVATPASGNDVYVSAAAMNGDATFMALNPDGTFADPEYLQVSSDNQISGYSFGNGIGDFNNDGQLDYILPLGRYGGDIYIFPKTGPGNQFDVPIWAGTWTEGVYPADMAIADFNGDGNLDFVLSYYSSAHCGLYLGDGDFGFSYTLLPGTKPKSALGIDAADFDNNEIADFVVAPRTSGPFYVSLGQPDGSFKLVLVDRAPSTTIATGIAAGDFVEDPDGFADLAVSSTGKLEIFVGRGDGTFSLYQEYEYPMNPSSLDNGDFDRDGHQDLVVADYGGARTGVAVLFGNGQGQFEQVDDTYIAENISFFKAVTALPFESNKAPVAVLTPEVVSVTVGEAVEWDASQSYDEDGTILSYEWDYGDGAVVPMALNTMTVDDTTDNSGKPQSSYVYYDSGTYAVTLTVTDDKGATATVQAEIRVNPIDVSVFFTPRKLNKKSKGKWITATIRVPQVPAGLDARMIEADSLFLVPPNGKAPIPAVVSKKHRNFSKYFNKYSKKSKRKYRKASKLKVKFNRQDLIEALDGATGEITLTVMGDISSMEFSGTGTIVAFEKQKKRSLKRHFMQQLRRLFSKGKSKHHG
jgi:PKD repeat protein